MNWDRCIHSEMEGFLRIRGLLECYKPFFVNFTHENDKFSSKIGGVSTPCTPPLPRSASDGHLGKFWTGQSTKLKSGQKNTEKNPGHKIRPQSLSLNQMVGPLLVLVVLMLCLINIYDFVSFCSIYTVLLFVKFLHTLYFCLEVHAQVHFLSSHEVGVFRNL